MASLLDPRMIATPENTYAPTKRDVGNLGGGLLSGLLGYPGDIQELARLGGNTAIGLLSKVNPVARQLGGLGGLLQARSGPTSEEVGASLGADPNTGAFMAGTIGAPDPNDIGRGLLGMTLFHGTPHKFDKFDLSKMGSGEGAQAKGWGLYFAESPGVAESYKSVGKARAARFEQTISPRAEFAGDFIEKGKSDIEVMEMMVKKYGPDLDFDEAMGAINEAKAAGFAPGHLYEADIPRKVIDQMLDWDAPLSEQPEAIQLLYRNNRTVLEDPMIVGWGTKEIKNGKDLYRALSKAANADIDLTGPLGSNLRRWGRGDEAASKLLNNEGIPGIRFYDGGSRAKGEGTRNIVVFDPDSTINSVKRDGEEVFKKGLLDTAPTRRDLERMDIDELDRAAFGYAEGDTATIPASDINIQWKGDLDNPQDLFEKRGMDWVNSVDLSEPVEVTMKQDGRIYLEDGHHRWFAAQRRGEPLKVKFVSIKGKPIEKLLDTDLHKELAAKSLLSPENF